MFNPSKSLSLPCILLAFTLIRESLSQNTTLCANSTCDAQFPNCLNYSAVNASSFGSIQFTCMNCKSGSWPTPGGVILQIQQLSNFLPNSANPAMVCLTKQNVTSINPNLTLPHCSMAVGMVNYSIQSYTFYCTDCKDGLVTNPYGVNNTLTLNASGNFSLLANQSACISSISSMKQLKLMLMLLLLFEFLQY